MGKSSISMVIFQLQTAAVVIPRGYSHVASPSLIWWAPLRDVTWCDHRQLFWGHGDSWPWLRNSPGSCLGGVGSNLKPRATAGMHPCVESSPYWFLEIHKGGVGLLIKLNDNTEHWLIFIPMLKINFDSILCDINKYIQIHINTYIYIYTYIHIYIYMHLPLHNGMRHAKGDAHPSIYFCIRETSHVVQPHDLIFQNISSSHVIPNKKNKI